MIMIYGSVRLIKRDLMGVHVITGWMPRRQLDWWAPLLVLGLVKWWHQNFITNFVGYGGCLYLLSLLDPYHGGILIRFDKNLTRFL